MIKFYGLDYTYYDHPNMYSLVLYSGGCNLKCHGCHNRHLAGWIYKTQDKESKEDVKISEYNKALSQADVDLAISNDTLDMIILCGGEMLINSVDEIKETVMYIKSKNPKVLIRIDTNGTFPDKVKELAERGQVDGFAIDIKGPYWDDTYSDEISSVLGLPRDFASKLYPKILQSLDIAKTLPYTLYRTVQYPIVQDKRYFDGIKSYVADNLHRPHYFSSYVEL